MSLLTVEEFEAVVGTGMAVATLQAVIDREEAELAHALGGPLGGSRTETYRPGVGYDGPVYLRRFASAVTVTDDGTAVVPRLIANGGAIERSDRSWSGTVAVTYTPADTARVKKALIELVRDVVAPDRDREAGSQRNLERIVEGDRRRARLVRSLRPRVGDTTLNVRTTDRVTPVTLT